MKAVLLYSGGLDSTTLLFQLVTDGVEVVPLFVSYGQRHRNEEYRAACEIAATFSLIPLVAELPGVTHLWGNNALTGRMLLQPAGVGPGDTVVPGRNLLFISLASMLALSYRADQIAIGCNADDAEVYADCRPEFINAAERAASHEIFAPYLDLTKRQVVERALALGVPIEKLGPATPEALPNAASVMRVFVGQTRARKLIVTLSSLGWGEMTMPNEIPPRRKPWVLDNGAYRAWKAGLACDFAPFEAALEGNDPEFVVAPDLPAQGLESLALSRAWLPRLEGHRAYLAAQDGMPLDEIARGLEGFAGLFVGGTLEWKLAHGSQLVALAHAAGKPCHVGRCGTGRRIRWAASIGADSIDSALPLWSVDKLQVAVEAVDMGRRQMQFDELMA